MKTRAITSIFIVVVTLFAILSKLLPYTIGNYLFDIFCLVIIIISGHEISNILEKCNRHTNKFMTTMYGVFNYGVLLILLNFEISFSMILLIEVLSLLVYGVIVLIVEAIKGKKENFNPLTTTINTIIACLYPAFWFGLLLQINHIDKYTIGNFSLIFILLVFAITMLTDTMAYLVGSTLKGPKLAPKISPKKTISGAIGGLIGGIIGSMLVYLLATQIPDWFAVVSLYGLAWWHFLVIGLVGSVLGQAGDLFESKLKRNAGVKDSGNIFPGHGGMLDRIDAMTFVIVFLYMLVAFIII